MFDDDASAARALVIALSRRPPANIAARLRNLADDLVRIREGTGPIVAELAAPPRLEDWSIAIAGGGPVLIGTVARHPILRERTIVTSGVWALDPHGPVWARTLSRWYALGAPAKAAPQSPKIRANLH